jgi:solute carrier family 25 folate transporter 32
MIASVATYPHEVLRTRLQVHKSHGRPSNAAAAAVHPITSTTHSSTASVNALASSVNGGKGPHAHFYSPLVTGSHPPLPLSAPAALLRVPAPGADPGSAVQKPAEPIWRRKGGIVQTFLEIKRQDGWKGFYRGLSINLVRTVPNSAVTMLT